MKPETSASAAPAVVTVTGSALGTVTAGGAAIVAPVAAVCGSIVTAHSPAPPPASVKVIACVSVAVDVTRPNESATGAAKTSGSFARSRLTTPPPSRTVEASTLRESPAKARSPVSASADFTCAGVQVGCRCSSSATAPATCGAAMLVPDSVVYWAPGAAERTFTPGALTSGFSCSESGVGPLDENHATTPAGPSRVDVTAPTVIASRVEPGDESEPRPNSA